MDPTCKLSSGAPETRQNFVAECSVFEIERNVFKQRIANYTALCIDQQDPDTFTRLVLDPSAIMVKPSVADECGLTQVELYTREGCLDLPERLELPERPPKYQKDQIMIGN